MYIFNKLGPWQTIYKLYTLLYLMNTNYTMFDDLWMNSFRRSLDSFYIRVWYVFWNSGWHQKRSSASLAECYLTQCFETRLKMCPSADADTAIWSVSVVFGSLIFPNCAQQYIEKFNFYLFYRFFIFQLMFCNHNLLFIILLRVGVLNNARVTV